MNDARKRILRRAVKAAGAVAIAASLGALGSAEFREFVGDDTLTAVLLGAGIPALLAAKKALDDRSPE